MMLDIRQRVRDLDFGGGLGIAYMILLESIRKEVDRLVHVIVDFPEICQFGCTSLVV